jgi:hypothetical protein
MIGWELSRSKTNNNINIKKIFRIIKMISKIFSIYFKSHTLKQQLNLLKNN